MMFTRRTLLCVLFCVLLQSYSYASIAFSEYRQGVGNRRLETIIERTIDTRIDLTCTIKCFHIWKLVAIQKKTFYFLVMTLMFSIYDHCMDCMISYNCMALLWKPCFQAWPFYGNHVFKYDPFMETMFSSMVILWIPCF